MEAANAEIQELRGHIFDQQINHARQMTELRIENDRLTRKLETFERVLTMVGIKPDQIHVGPNMEQLQSVRSRVPLPQILPMATTAITSRAETIDPTLAEETLVRMKKRRRIDTSEAIKLTR
jgi:hypothetical protein